MAYKIGTITKASGSDLNCHYQLIDIIENLAVANGWELLRKSEDATYKTIFLKGSGLTGTEEIFVNFRAYHSTTADYYNIACEVAMGYVSDADFGYQPGSKVVSSPAHNMAITYYIAVNAQRIVFMLKVGTPIYSHIYAGKFFPYTRPTQYPYPVCVGGCWNGVAGNRYSLTSTYFPYHGGGVGQTVNLYVRNLIGQWITPSAFPFFHANNAAQYYAIASSTKCLAPSYSGIYPLLPVELYTVGQYLYGALDGVKYVSGFNNTAENVVQFGGSSVVDQTGLTIPQAVNAIHSVGGKAYIMAQNVWRTGWRDYVAIEME